MNNYEKKLDALIDALGFDVERVNDMKRIYRREDLQDNGEPKENALPNCIIDNSTYKLTKRKDTELVKAMDRAIELMYSEFGRVEPEIVAAFEAAGAN